jgi:uncharacterized ferredoxin-like protein
MTLSRGVYDPADTAVRSRPGAFEEFTCATCGETRCVKIKTNRYKRQRTCSPTCAAAYHASSSRLACRLSSNRVHATTFEIDHDLYHRVQALAARNGVSLGEIYRRATRAYVDREEEVAP